MPDAFGVSKKERKRVPDWALATMPASTAAAYNRAKTRKKEAAASNFAVKSGAAAATAGTVAGSVFLLSRGKKLPKFFLRPSEVKVPKTNIKATITPGEKQRTLASAVGGAAAGGVGGYAGQKHLKSIKNNPRYGTEKVGKGLPSALRGAKAADFPKGSYLQNRLYAHGGGQSVSRSLSWNRTREGINPKGQYNAKEERKALLANRKKKYPHARSTDKQLLGSWNMNYAIGQQRSLRRISRERLADTRTQNGKRSLP